MLMLLFYVGNEMFACETTHIIEIIPKINIKRSLTPEDFVGTIDFDEKQIPVIDFCELIRNSQASNKIHTRIILFRNPSQDQPIPYLGVIAEKVTRTFEGNPSDFNPTGLKPYLGGVLSGADGPIQWVLIDQLPTKSALLNQSSNEHA